MSKLYSHISTAIKVIEKYNGHEPLASFLKKFFATEKKYGSNDRKSIATLCYAYFRAGHIVKSKDKSDQILAGLFLTENASNSFLQDLRPDLNDKIILLTEEKLKVLEISIEDIFPFRNELSEELDKSGYAYSLLKQPMLFLRTRPGKFDTVVQKLNDAAIPFKMISEDSLSLNNSVRIDNILKINSEVVIQDMNSQNVLNFLNDNNSILPKNKITDAWDCCAASGGKSMLLFDRLKGNVRLTVSDIRQVILTALKKRMEESGIDIYKSFVTDLEHSLIDLTDKFDIVLCDAPCTGSGTFSRNPEQVFYFKIKKIDEYASLQKNIISNSIPALNHSGIFIYITCSAFSKENEVQVNFIQDNFPMTLLHMEYFKGYNNFADTMFVAVFQKV